jgi:hypothetical protein
VNPGGADWHAAIRGRSIVRRNLDRSFCNAQYARYDASDLDRKKMLNKMSTKHKLSPLAADWRLDRQTKQQRQRHLQNPMDVEALREFDFARFGILARSLQVLLGHGQLPLALLAVRQFFACTRRDAVSFETPLADAIPVRYCNALQEKYGWDLNVGAFCKMSDAEVTGVDQCGDMVRELRDALKAEVTSGVRRKYIESEDELWFDFDAWDASADACLAITKVRLEKDQVVEKVSVATEEVIVSASNEISVVDALKVLASKSDEAVAELDARIANYKAKILDLRKMRRMLAGPGTSGPRAAGQQSDKMREVADKLVECMQPGARYLPKELADLISSSYMTVGRAARSDARFTVSGRFISLA